MNNIYKVIWSKAKNCYVVVSEMAKQNAKSVKCVMSAVRAAVALTVVLGLTIGIDNYTLASSANDIKAAGGSVAYDISPGNDGANIVVGSNAKAFIGGGTQEAIISFGEEVTKNSFFGYVYSMNIHSNSNAKKILPDTIAVGTNSYARTGSIDFGGRTLKDDIAIGDTTAKQAMSARFGVGATTFGTDSYTAGGFATTVGSYNIQSGTYDGSNSYDSSRAAFGTIIGSFNSNESYKASLGSVSRYSGISNVIAGAANRVNNSNGTVVIGAGNTVEDTNADLYDLGSALSNTTSNSVNALQKKLMQGIKDANGGGAAMVIGGGNTVSKSKQTQVLGVNNSVSDTTGSFIDGIDNEISGSKNTVVLGASNKVTKADGNIMVGSYHTIEESKNNNVIIGSAPDAKKEITVSASKTVALGYNAQAEKDEGVALGSDSIASIDKDATGANPMGVTISAADLNSATWKSKAAAVSVGSSADGITRQITNVAAGTKPTDAVNVAQLETLKVEVAEGSNIKVEKDVSNGYTIYTISTKEYDIKPGNANVTVDSVEEENKITYTVGAEGGGGTPVEVLAGDNVEVKKGTEGNTTTYTISTKAEGAVLAGDTKAVSGDTVYKETRVQQDGNYIKKDNTAGENITALDEKVKDNSDRIDHISNQFGSLDNRMRKGLAGAAALAALHPMDFNPDDKLQFSAGVGNYRGETAAALGAFYRPDESVMFSVGGTFGNADNMVNAGITFGLDGTRNRVTRSRTAMAKEIVELRSLVTQMAARMDRMEAANGIETTMFPDVPENHWAYEYVEDLQKRGALKGYPDGLFKGDRAMTRYEFAAMLDRIVRDGIRLDPKIAREFEPELGRIYVERISGDDNDRKKVERVRVNNSDSKYPEGKNRDVYGSKIIIPASKIVAGK